MQITKPYLFHVESSLGSLEIEVIKIIWKKNRVTVREIVDIFNKEKPVAYTTIMTVMNHLHAKFFLDRIKIGKTYYYHPAISTDSAVSNSFSNTFKSLSSDYGRRKVLSAVITYSLIPKINLPIISSYSTPARYSLFLTIGITLFGLSLYDLFENLKFFGALDYLKLFASEPAIFWDKVNLAIFAFVESLPIINIFTTLVSFIMMVYLVKRLIKLLHFPTRVSL